MRTFLTQLYTDTPMTSAALIIFFVAFVGLCLWVFARKGAKSEYEKMAQLPLMEKGVGRE